MRLTMLYNEHYGAVVEAACLESRRLRVRTPLWPVRAVSSHLSHYP